MYITKSFFFSWTIENKSSLLNTLVSFFFFSCKQQYSRSSVSLNVGPLNHQHQHLLITHQAGKFSSPTPDLLNQKLRDEVQLSTTYSTSVLDDSDEHSRLHAMCFIVSLPHYNHTNQEINTDKLLSSTAHNPFTFCQFPYLPYPYSKGMTPRLSYCIYLSCSFKIAFSQEQLLNLSWVFITSTLLRMTGQLFCRVFLRLHLFDVSS